jgi:hypothetical protein
MRDALQADPQFTVNFEASQVAESLVITAKSSSDLPVEGILNFFDVRSKLSGIDDFISVVPIPTPASTGVEAISSAVTWENDTFNKRTTNVHFDRCIFEDVPMAIKCFQNRSFETEIKFTACEIVGADTGVFLRGTDDDLAETEQKNNWKFFDCRFENISKEAIWSTRGIGVTVDRSEVKNCGNNNLSPIEPSYNIFKFGTRQGNVIINTQIDRHQIAGITLDTTKIPVSEASNAASVEISNVYFSPLYKSSTPYMLASFSTTNRYTLIDYVLELSGYVRKGTLTIVIDDALAGRTEELAIADNFTYSSGLSTSTGGSIMTSFEFSATLVDNETDDSSQTDTFLLRYVNPLGSIDPLGTISYRLRFGV